MNRPFAERFSVVFRECGAQVCLTVAGQPRVLFVEIEPFVRLQKWARAHVEAEAERLAGFLGGELNVSIR